MARKVITPRPDYITKMKKMNIFYLVHDAHLCAVALADCLAHPLANV